MISISRVAATFRRFCTCTPYLPTMPMKYLLASSSQGSVYVQSAEFAEAVGGEEYLFGAVIGYHNLRPVHHGREHEGQLMIAEGKGAAVAHLDFLSL